MSMRPICLCLLFSVIPILADAQSPAAEPSAPIAAVPAAGSPDEMVGPIKLPDAEIDTVLGLLEIYTGRSILRPQQLPTATYRLVYDRKLPKSDAILALETILALNQIGVAPMGDKFLKVVALSQVKTETPEMITGSTLQLPPSGRTATKLFQLNFLRVNEFIPQIMPILSPGIANGIVPLDKANAALITDSISNLQRVEQLINQLDAPTMAGLTPKFYALHNGAKASDLVGKLRAMFQGPLQGQLGSSISYSADDRTNQIILLADERQIPLFDELIAKLDVKSDPNTRNEVIYLKHASAKEVAPLLSQLVSGQTAAAQKAGGGAPTIRPPGAPAQPNPAPDAAIPDSTNEFSSLITIVPDERSNAVVVSGTVDDIRLIRDLVEKIDIILAQVRIEVVIAEVTLSDRVKTGISALELKIGEHNGITKVTNFSGDLSGIKIASGTVDTLGFIASLSDAGGRSDLKVLSAPNITTVHNKEAQILVGESRPIITGVQSTPLGTTGTAIESSFAQNSQVTYKDIAIDLKVTPLIGDDGSVQLKIDQKVDDIVDNVTINGNPQPVIGRRQATSFINVRDGELIVLGGLQRSKNNRSRGKIGFLAEIPILSHIFGARNNSTERTELLLFIRPKVIRPEQGTADTTRAINSQSNREQINQYLSDPSKKPKEPLLEKLK